MANKRIYDLSTTTALAAKFLAVDKAGNAEAEKFDAAQIVTLSGAQTITGTKTFTRAAFGSGSAYIEQSGSDLTFYDSLIPGGVSLTALAASGVTFGSANQIPFVNTFGSDFSYSSGLNYTTGILTAANINISAQAAAVDPQLVTAAVATGSLQSQTQLTFAGSVLTVGSAIQTDTVKFVDASTTITRDVLNNLSFTDGITGTRTLAQLAASQILNLGTIGQIPYMNAVGTDFSYSSGFHLTTGILTAANVAVSAIASSLYNNIVFAAPVTGQLGNTNSLNWDGTYLNTPGLAMTGASVDTIETTLTNDNTHLATSGAIFAAIAAIPTQILTLGTTTQIPYMNVGGTDFIYTSSLVYESGFLKVGQLKISSLAGGPYVLFSTLATGAVQAQSNFSFDGTNLSTDGIKLSIGATVNTIETTLTNDATHLATSSAIFAAIGAVAVPSYGSSGKIPYMNAGGTDFLYTTDMVYSTGVLTVSALAIASLATGGALLFTQVATGNVQQSANLTFSGSTLVVGGSAAASEIHLDHSGTYEWKIVAQGDTALEIQYFSSIPLTIATGGITVDGSITLLSGATVDNIETTLTNDATHIATSSAIFAAISAITPPSLGTTEQIPYMNVGGTDFLYSSGLTYSSGFLVCPGGIKVSSLSSGTDSIVMASGGGVGQLQTSGNLYFSGSTLTVGGSSATSYIKLDNTSTYNWEIGTNGTTLTFKYYTQTFLTLSGSTVTANGSFALAAGASVNDIETTLTNDDTHLPTSGAVFDAIGAITSSPWVADATGIGYSAGVVGIGGASAANLTLNITGGASDLRQLQIQKNNTSLSAWVDFPTSLPTGYSFLLTTGAGVYGSLDWNGIAINARGNVSGAANAYVILAAVSQSTSNHASRFNVMVRGTGVSDYVTISSHDYNFTHYWRSETAAQDITHYFRQASSNVAVFGYDDSVDDFVFCVKQDGAVTYDNYHHRLKLTQYSVDIAGYQNGSLYVNAGSDITTRNATLQIIAASAGDAYISFRQSGGGTFICGWDDTYNHWQLHYGGFTTAAAGHFSITTAGALYAGTLSSSSGTYYMRYNTTTGLMSYTTSDRRNKKDIKPFKVNALQTLNSFDPKSFTWKEDGKRQNGWIAQEGKEIIPEMFPFIDKIDRYGMDEFNILPYFHKAIQELTAEIDNLKKQLNEKS